MLIGFISSKVIYLQFRIITNAVLVILKCVCKLSDSSAETLKASFGSLAVVILPIVPEVGDTYLCIYGFPVNCGQTNELKYTSYQCIFSQEKKLGLIVYLENLRMCFWECHCLLQQNNRGISAQVEKRKMIHYFKNYFTVSPENRWKLLTIYNGEQGLAYYLRLCFKEKEVQTSHF